jgi:hypothetical protein
VTAIPEVYNIESLLRRENLKRLLNATLIYVNSKTRSIIDSTVERDIHVDTGGIS